MYGPSTVLIQITMNVLYSNKLVVIAYAVESTVGQSKENTKKVNK